MSSSTPKSGQYLMHESPNGAFSLVPLVRPDDAYSTVLYNVQAACATARALESRCVGMFRGLILYCTIPPPPGSLVPSPLSTATSQGSRQGLSSQSIK